MTEENDFTPRGRELTGWKVLMIFGGGFAVILGVNLFMAFSAVSTFSGMEVSSSYADSQDFDERREAQEALGWTVDVELDEAEGMLTLHLLDSEGNAAVPAEFQALLTRPTNLEEDQLLDLTRSSGAFVAPVDIAPGRWRLRLTGTARDGTDYRRNITFHVRG